MVIDSILCLEKRMERPGTLAERTPQFLTIFGTLGLLRG